MEHSVWQPPEREDLVGNYFVAAYPPFACWTEPASKRFRDSLELRGETPAPLGLYVHIPFCVKRCEYCYYLSYEDRPEEVDRYLDALTYELGLYAATPALAGRKPAFVYFGGGTPSVLSTTRITRLMKQLQQILPWSETREISFECAPRTVNSGKLQVLRDAGVNRLSLGVQQLDDRVLTQNGRVHLVRDVERAYDAVRSVGFDTVNVDLIVGLVGETEQTFLSSLDRVIAMEPDCVTIYQLEIPLNTPLYRALAAGDLGALPPPWPVKRTRLRTGFSRLESAGYTLRSAYTATREPERHPFVYQDEQYGGADLLGVGVSSFSYLAGIHHQNVASLRKYLDAVEGGHLPLWRAHALSREERLVREFVLQLKLGRIDRKAFSDKFGVDVTRRFADPLRRFVQRGWIDVDQDTIALTREGLLRADNLLGAFYLPEHRDLRYS